MYVLYTTHIGQQQITVCVRVNVCYMHHTIRSLLYVWVGGHASGITDNIMENGHMLINIKLNRVVKIFWDKSLFMWLTTGGIFQDWP